MSDLREIVARANYNKKPLYIGLNEVTWDELNNSKLNPNFKARLSEELEDADAILSALRAEGALVGSKLAAEIGNAFTGFPKCHMFVRYKSDGLGEPHDEGSYYAIKIQDKGPSINFGMTELALELFANEALSRIEADRATNTQEGE